MREAWVEGAQQKRALHLLNQYVFAEDAFTFPKAYFAMLASNPNVPGNQPGAAAREFPIFDTFASFQRGMLQELFTPDRLARLANSEFRAASPQDALTMATLFRSVGDRVWSELRDGREISELRRSLQVDHLNLLIDVAMNRDPKLPADAITLAWEELRQLTSRRVRPGSPAGGAAADSARNGRAAGREAIGAGFRGSACPHIHTPHSGAAGAEDRLSPAE